MSPYFKSFYLSATPIKEVNNKTSLHKGSDNWERLHVTRIRNDKIEKNWLTFSDAQSET